MNTDSTNGLDGYQPYSGMYPANHRPTTCPSGTSNRLKPDQQATRRVNKPFGQVKQQTNDWLIGQRISLN